MAKAKFKQPWFEHDYNSRHDPKLLELVSELKYQGLGVYWCLIEILYEQGGYLPKDKIKSFAYSLKVKQEFLIKILENFELFEKNEIFYFSNACLERLKNKDEISSIRSVNGTKGGIAKANKKIANATNLPEQNIAIRGKEITENENKEEEIILEQRKEDNIVPSEGNESLLSSSINNSPLYSSSNPSGNAYADSSPTIENNKTSYGTYNNVLLSNEDIISFRKEVVNEDLINKLINELSEKRTKGDNDYSYKKNDIKLLKGFYKSHIKFNPVIEDTNPVEKDKTESESIPVKNINNNRAIEEERIELYGYCRNIPMTKKQYNYLETGFKKKNLNMEIVERAISAGIQFKNADPLKGYELLKEALENEQVYYNDYYNNSYLKEFDEKIKLLKVKNEI